MGGRQDSVLKSRRMDGIVLELREQKEAGMALIFTMEHEASGMPCGMPGE